MSRTIKASELRARMTVSRITVHASSNTYDLPVVGPGHGDGSWPTVTRVSYPDPYGTVWFTLSCCDSTAVRVAPDDEITVED